MTTTPTKRSTQSIPVHERPDNELESQQAGENIAHAQTPPTKTATEMTDAELDAFMQFGAAANHRGRDSPGQLYSLQEDSGRTDVANASRFIGRYAHELLYVPAWHKWLCWDGQRWADDSRVGVTQRAKRYAKSLWGEWAKLGPVMQPRELAKVTTFVKATNRAHGIQDFLTLAAVDERVVCQVEELNSDPLLLNVANGTIDLTTGKLRPHNPADRLTQLAPVNFDPEATCPKWCETLELIFDGDAELIRYVQMLLGYSISGDTGEHLLPVCFGDGNNGKSTLWNTVCALLGDYASPAHESLLLGDGKQHPTEKAALYQLRFVPISEPEHGASLRQSRTKELTGERYITARRMKEDFWKFKRTHTFWLSTNYLPRIDGTDDGIWRRFKVIPFRVDIGERVKPIKAFDEWLVANEGPGILRWLVDGFLAYRAEGLTEPAAVIEATGRHRDDSDPLGDFLAEHCVIEDGAVGPAKVLYAAYRQFAGDDKRAWSQSRFGKMLGEKFKRHRPDSGEFRKETVYFGVRLRDSFSDGGAAVDGEKAPQKL